MKQTVALIFLALALVSCAKDNKPVGPVEPTAPRDCDQPSRDETGRPIDLC